MKLFAALISYFFSPPLLLIASIYLYLVGHGFTVNEALTRTALMTAFTVIPFLAILIVMKRKGYISDYDLRKREERPLAMLFALACTLVAVVLVYFTGPPLLLNIALVFFVWIALFSTITLFWKISAHSAAATLFTLVALPQSKVQVLGIVMIALVCWSRIYRKNHTLYQVVGGFFLSIMVMMFAFWRHLL